MILGDCPPEAVADDGRPRLGVYRGALAKIALDRAATPFQRRWRRKFWQYAAVVSPEVVAAAAVVDLGYVGMAFALAWDRTRKIWFEREALVPLASGIRCAGEPPESTFSYQGRAGRIAMANTPDERTIEVRFTTPAGELEMDVEMAPSGEGTEALSVVGALAPGRPNVTIKEAGVALGGRIKMGDREVQLEPESAFGLLDWTQGIPPTDVTWNWAMAAGRTADGRTVGFNLCVGFTDPEHSENGVWLDGQVHRIRSVSFTIPKEEGAPWRIVGAQGALDLTFHPEAQRHANTNLLIAVSRYRQPVGRYEGTVPDADGNAVRLEAVSGVAEEHTARW